MKKLNVLALLLIALVIVVAGCRKPPETAETLVLKVLAAHGGEEALRQVKGYLFHGHAKSLADEEQGKLWIIYRHPDKLRVVVEMTDAREERLYLQGIGWNDDGKGFKSASGMILDLMKFQTEHLSLPLRLLEGKYRASLLGEIVEGEPIRLALTDTDGLETRISIDPVRMVIRAAERDFEVGNQKVVMAVLYEEYRTIKGVQLPHRILNFINGNPVGRTDFTSVQINPSIPEKIFSAPGQGAR